MRSHYPCFPVRSAYCHPYAPPPFHQQDPLADYQKKSPPWLTQTQETLSQKIGKDANYEAYFETPKLQRSLSTKIMAAQKKAVESNMTLREKALMKATSAKGAANWVYAAPRQGYTLTNTEYSAAMRL
eukprot:gb/GECG01002905.1/.p1 GENE.gb/GECG01002905.1/~~gb/GECG01002905.1/.p1  ORF type:complete len:128 (+),score=18.35 gb/GECG01002905.1/:1-384(+)